MKRRVKHIKTGNTGTLSETPLTFSHDYFASVEWDNRIQQMDDQIKQASKAYIVPWDLLKMLEDE